MQRRAETTAKLSDAALGIAVLWLVKIGEFDGSGGGFHASISLAAMMSPPRLRIHTVIIAMLTHELMLPREFAELRAERANAWS